MTTRTPLTLSEYEYLCRRKQSGASHREVATEIGCSLTTVKKHWRRHRRGEVVAPPGRPKRGVLSTYDEELRCTALTLKRQHPHWGPDMVCIELQHQFSLDKEDLPHRSRLSALFKAECPEAVQPRHRAPVRSAKPSAVHQAHQRWQMDAKEKVCLASGETVTVLDIRDPAAALMINAHVIATAQVGRESQRPTRAEMQATLRQAFVEWGLPLEIQTDHEGVYVGAALSDFPSPFTLWLTGLGIMHRLIRPGCPTDQGAVERTHGTEGNMTWKNELYLSVDALQAALDAIRRCYHYEFPVRAKGCAGQPPLVVHPVAHHSGRPYRPECEHALFDIHRVDTFLSPLQWKRRTDVNGSLTLGNHVYYVGRAYKKQAVSVRFIAERRSFAFRIENTSVVIERSARGLNAEDLIGYLPIQDNAPFDFQLPLPFLVGV